LFRAWLFKIARNALCRHYGKQTREVETVSLTDINERLAASRHKPAAPPVFEFQHWMAFLNSSEREVMTLRFLERWKYHEIADAHTIKWRVFNAKKKLALHLTTRLNSTRKAA
jgi:DNA-directed RNA polymerase specialized sigma24 family protein